MPATVDAGFVRMRVSKVTALGEPGENVSHHDDLSHYVVLDELNGDRHLLILIGPTEAFGLAATLGGTQWRRPMTYQFAVALVQSLGGRVRVVRIDRVAHGTYAATVEVEGLLGAQSVDARASDALNVAAVTSAPVFVSPEVIDDSRSRQEDDSPEAELLRLALTVPQMTITRDLPRRETH